MNNKTLVRTLVAIPLILVMFAIIIVRSYFYMAMMSLIAVVCMFEATKAMRSAGYNPNFSTAIIFGLGLYPTYYFLGPKAVLVLAVSMITFNLIWAVFDKEARFMDAVVSSFVLCYPGSLFYAFIFVGELQPYALSVFIMALAMVTSVLSDTGAYFVGRMFGKRKLAPDISPNKTVEGAIGGLLTSVAFVAIALIIIKRFGILSSYPSIVNMPWYHVVVCTFLIVIFAQIGDLVASLFKRFANIKDFSQILLGHGGAMDRMDSILFAVTAAVIYFCVFVF